jgi:hypothetical protein
MSESIQLRNAAASGKFGIGPDTRAARAIRALVVRRLGMLGFLLAAVFWLLESAIHTWVFREASYVENLLTTDPNELWMRFLTVSFLVGGGAISAAVVGRLARLERRNEDLHRQLEAALTKLLGGFVSICMHCKSIRDRDERWEPLDAYLATRTAMQFSHGICPRCFSQHYPDDDVAGEKS